jgi:hypothetical protein
VGGYEKLPLPLSVLVFKLELQILKIPHHFHLVSSQLADGLCLLILNPPQYWILSEKVGLLDGNAFSNRAHLSGELCVEIL